MDFEARLEAVRERVRAACARAGRDPGAVQILAVTKGHAPPVVREALDAGQVLFGENKVQEARAKIPECPARARWHFIGHLQTNKCREAVRWFEMIHSVDTLRVAEALDKAAEAAARRMPVLLEVNVAGESAKFGFSPEAVLNQMEALNALPRLEIHGLMTLAPWSQDSERARPVFRRLRELKSHCEDRLGAPLAHLSMGMSGDFEAAVEEGATLVRLGTCLFGARS